MAICMAPCFLSWMATGHAQRLGAREEAPSHLRYFCPMILYPHSVGESCPRVEVGPSTARGSRQQGVPLLSGSGSTPGLTTASEGQAVQHTRFLWKPSCTKTRGKPSARRLYVSCPDFLSQPAGTHDFLQSHSTCWSQGCSSPKKKRDAAGKQGKGDRVNEAGERANTKLLTVGAGWDFHTLAGCPHVGLGLEPATSWQPAVMPGGQQQPMRHTKGISHQHRAHGGQGGSQRVGLPPVRPLSAPRMGLSHQCHVPTTLHPQLGQHPAAPQRQVSSSHSWAGLL